MTTRKYSSTAQQTTLAAGCTDSATSIAVTATTGFPAVDFTLALDYGAAGQELVLVTNVSGTTLTVTRGYDSTTASAHSLGAVVAHVHGGIDFRDSRTHEAASSGVHGITGSVVGTTDTQALSGKDLSSGNTFPATLLTASSTSTLTNKTIALGSNTVSGTKAQFNTALTDGDFASQAGTETLTNKTVALGSNTVSGTTAEFNTANTDGDFATLAGTETLTNKTLTSPTVNTPTISSPTITGIGAETFVAKTVDESVSSSTTLQNDDALTCSVPTAGTYVIDAHVLAASAADAAGDINLGFTFPTGTLALGGAGADTALTSGNIEPGQWGSQPSVVSGAGFNAYGLSQSPTYIHIHGLLTATASGTLHLQWAQSVSNSNASTVKAGSHLSLRRVA